MESAFEEDRSFRFEMEKHLTFFSVSSFSHHSTFSSLPFL